MMLLAAVIVSAPLCSAQDVFITSRDVVIMVNMSRSRYLILVKMFSVYYCFLHPVHLLRLVISFVFILLVKFV